MVTIKIEITAEKSLAEAILQAMEKKHNAAMENDAVNYLKNANNELKKEAAFLKDLILKNPAEKSNP